MKKAEKALHESPPSGKSMGNTYAVFADRIELNCRFPFITRTLVIKKEDLVAIDTYRPPVLRTTFWALKLDLADLHEHVGITRSNGFFKQLRFTPENPKGFVAKVREIFGLDR
jgi:hypothetical protein